jgi:transcriptional regulator with XRE-family HTH domain
MVIIMDINNRIREIRKQRGITAKFVAEKCGLSAAMLSEIERGKCNVSIKQAIAIADFFGVTLDYLARGNDSHCNDKNHSRFEGMAA